MNIRNTIIEHYKKFFDLHAKGIALTEDDHLNIDWAESLVKDCFIPDVVGSKPTGLMIESGKSYKLRHPNGAGDKDRLHIDYILDNPANSHWSYKLVVCRYWGKHKQRWFYYTYPYFSLAIYNDWDYGGGDV